ncbi:3'(2'),5'-bisphosphate nucleotidase SAL1 [Gracilaria domingensis]|nr:3'(2'),5'-bisphosphate nucleotidase SAL1 [Gracilaria domingensis]
MHATANGWSPPRATRTTASGDEAGITRARARTRTTSATSLDTSAPANMALSARVCGARTRRPCSVAPHGHGASPLVACGVGFAFAVRISGYTPSLVCFGRRLCSRSPLWRSRRLQRSHFRPARRAVHALANMLDVATNLYKHEHSIALAAVANASRLARALQSKFESEGALTKKDNSPVTVADFAVQALIVHKLLTSFPDDKFIAEETTTALVKDAQLRKDVVSATGLTEQQVLAAIDVCSHTGGDGARTWILDPIDGTRGFIAMRQYCIALGFIEQGVVKLGVLGCPNLPVDKAQHPDSGTDVGCLFHAVLGGGSWMTSERDIRPGDASPNSVLQPAAHRKCHVSDIDNPQRSILCESVESLHSSHDLSAQVASLLGVSAPPVRMDSQAKYGCMARGEFGIFLRFPRMGYVENVWDSAPAAIIVEEAGGRVTDGKGKPLNFSLGRTMDNEDGIVATNGIVHDQVISAVQQVMSESRNSL